MSRPTLVKVLDRIGSPAAMQRRVREWQKQGLAIGLVPTMGYLHEGHLSLVQKARRVVGPQGKVVLSIYVNPTQFAPTEDLARYPRDLKRDLRLCHDAGVDVVFHPTDEGMYPGRGQGDPGYSTYVVEETLGRRLEGESRPTHFRGVTTIVAKLFHLVLPDVAVFGAKDWQQAAIIRRMVRDLNFPVRVIVAPTVREADGLAMSSRNKYLEGSLRGQATVLWRALQGARRKVKEQGRVPMVTLQREVATLVAAQPDARLDYVACFDPVTLTAVPEARRGCQMALAVFVGKTRLIDNARL